jgi:hypothetical protein
LRMVVGKPCIKILKSLIVNVPIMLLAVNGIFGRQ